MRSIEQGRESYYELCEPLMRLCMEVKKQRGEPVNLLVEFLQIWYTESELQHWLEQPEAFGRLDASYVVRALDALKRQPIDPKLKAQLKALGKCVGGSDPGLAFALLQEIASVQTSGELSAHFRALVLLSHKVNPATLDKLRLESGTLVADLEWGIPLWQQSLTKANSQEVFFLWLGASITLYALDEQKGTHLLQQLATLLIRFPAQANLAVLRCIRGVEPTKFANWFGVLAKQLLDQTSLLEVKRFNRVGIRMTKSLSGWLETRDSKIFLTLPSEERKLVIAFAEKMNPTKRDPGEQSKLVADLLKLQP